MKESFYERYEMNLDHKHYTVMVPQTGRDMVVGYYDNNYVDAAQIG